MFPVVYVNKYGVIIRKNAEFSTFFGCNEKRFLAYIYPKYKQELYNRIKELYNKKDNKAYITYYADFLTKEKKRITAKVFLSKTKSGIIKITIIDISDIKEHEKKMLNTLIKNEKKDKEILSAKLHDNVLPMLSTLGLYLELLSEKCHDKDAVKITSDMQKILKETTTFIRDISHNTSPTILRDFGLIKAIEVFVSYINKTNKIDINLNIKNFNNHRLDNTTEFILYQVIKELLTNAVKHSKSEKVILSLEVTDTLVHLYYRDYGIGMDIHKHFNSPNALGLRNIFSKVNSLNGECEITSNYKKGTIVSIIIPKI